MSIKRIVSFKKKKRWGGGFPGDSVVKNLPANIGDPEFDPWSRKIPHAEKQLSRAPYLLNLGSRAQEPQLRKPLEPTFHNNEATTRSLHNATREGSPPATATEQPM